MADIISFNGLTKPPKHKEGEEPAIIKELDNSHYYTLITPDGKYAKELVQIMEYTEGADPFTLVLYLFAFGCIVGKREDRARKKAAGSDAEAKYNTFLDGLDKIRACVHDIDEIREYLKDNGKHINEVEATQAQLIIKEITRNRRGKK